MNSDQLRGAGWVLVAILGLSSMGASSPTLLGPWTLGQCLSTAPPGLQSQEPAEATDDSLARTKNAAAEGKFMLSLTLERALNLALDNSFSVRSADIDVEIAAQREQIERAVFDPSLAVSGSFQKNRDPSTSALELGAGDIVEENILVNPSERQDYSVGVEGRMTTGTRYGVSIRQIRLDQPESADVNIFGINPQDLVAVTAEIRQPLLKGAGFKANTAPVRIATNRRRTASQDRVAARDLHLFRVEEAYWLLAFALQNYDARQQSLTTEQENLLRLETEAQAGQLAESDTLIAQDQLLLREVELDQALVDVNNAKDRFLLLLNRPRSAGYGLTEDDRLDRGFDQVWVETTSDPDTKPFRQNRERAVQTAFENRPEYQRLITEIETQRIEIGLAGNDRLAQLDVVGSWSQLGLDDGIGESYSEWGSGRFYDWSIAVEFSVPFGNRAGRNRELATRGRLRQLQLQKNQLEGAILVEVDRVLREIADLETRITRLDRRVQIQEKLANKKRDEVKGGFATYYDVSRIENDLVDSRTQALRAKLDYATAKAEFLLVTGTLHGTRLARGN